MYRAKVIFAATLTAGIAYGSFIYTEVPKPFTKKDYVTAVTYEGELNAKQAEMLRLMDEDAKAQMKERNDPAADYVIVPTKDGAPWEGALVAEGTNNVVHVLDTSALPAGVYLYRVTAGADVAIKKMVVAR